MNYLFILFLWSYVVSERGSLILTEIPIDPHMLTCSQGEVEMMARVVVSGASVESTPRTLAGMGV
jgi:hypothetical protein